jgi:hypothetical protein
MGACGGVQVHVVVYGCTGACGGVQVHVVVYGCTGACGGEDLLFLVVEEVVGLAVVFTT